MAKLLTPSEIAKKLGVGLNEEKQVKFQDKIFWKGSYGGNYWFDGIKILEKESGKTFLVVTGIYNDKYPGDLQWSQIPAKTKREVISQISKEFLQ